MRLSALIHVVRTTLDLMGEGQIVVVGSSSLLASFPNLGEAGEPLATSYDADVIPEPFDEDVGIMIHEALGEDRRFHRRHGYHADVIRPTMFEQFPEGWRDRCVPLPDCPNVRCLEPHDLAAAKCQVGRPKDLDLLIALVQSERLDPDLVRERLRGVQMAEQQIRSSHQNLDQVISEASK
ncbi:MAG: hypothetical protein ACI8T1_005407 [Verrucomicrobiales bacterium]|jgi:hypothetical protein